MASQSLNNSHSNIELENDMKLLKEELLRLHEVVRKRTSEVDEVVSQLERLAAEVVSSRRQLTLA